MIDKNWMNFWRKKLRFSDIFFQCRFVFLGWRTFLSPCFFNKIGAALCDISPTSKFSSCSRGLCEKKRQQQPRQWKSSIFCCTICFLHTLASDQKNTVAVSFSFGIRFLFGGVWVTCIIWFDISSFRTSSFQNTAEALTKVQCLPPPPYHSVLAVPFVIFRRKKSSHKSGWSLLSDWNLSTPLKFDEWIQWIPKKVVWKYCLEDVS